MSKSVFTEDVVSDQARTVYERKRVTNFVKVIKADAERSKERRAVAFSQSVRDGFFSDFEKPTDKMCHVTTFVEVGDKIYVSYYANTAGEMENPDTQVARLAYCDKRDPSNKIILDVQAAGDTLDGRKIVGVYDTILMQDPHNPHLIYVLWTANVDGKYYRLYRAFDTVIEQLGAIGVNRFRVGAIVNDFSSSGMQNALAANGIGYKEFFSDIGIMQKQSWREENGKRYCYSGAYSGNFTCIIKSVDMITWEYVAQPNEGKDGTGFENETEWENAVYVLDDKVYTFIRQWWPVYGEDGSLKEGSPYGILTYYDLVSGRWHAPVLVEDCQSRSDFVLYKDELYLFHAPTDRNHIGALRVDRDDLTKTEVVFQADMQGSCFYPFVQVLGGELAMSYTVDRKHVRLAKFDANECLS